MSICQKISDSLVGKALPESAMDSKFAQDYAAGHILRLIGILFVSLVALNCAFSIPAILTTKTHMLSNIAQFSAVSSPILVVGGSLFIAGIIQQMRFQDQIEKHLKKVELQEFKSAEEIELDA